MITIGRMTAPGRRTPTLYHWAGDAEAFERLTELFYRKVHEDPLLAPVFAHVGPDHAHHVAIWLAEVFGGPSRYTEELSGYAAMMRHHLGLHLTEEKRRRWAQLLAETSEVKGLPV
jgi:hemoglobin